MPRLRNGEPAVVKAVLDAIDKTPELFQSLQPCAPASGSIWTCRLALADQRSGLVVWDTNEDPSTGYPCAASLGASPTHCPPSRSSRWQTKGRLP